MNDAAPFTSSAQNVPSRMNPGSTAPRTVSAWADLFFGHNTTVTTAIETLFDDKDYGIEALYNPALSVWTALQPSYFDLEDYIPPTEPIILHKVAKLFKNAAKDNEKVIRVVTTLRRLHQIMKDLGMSTTYPKKREKQLAMARDLLSTHTTDVLQRQFGMAYKKLFALNTIAMPLWAHRQSIVASTPSIAADHPFPAVYSL